MQDVAESRGSQHTAGGGDATAVNLERMLPHWVLCCGWMTCQHCVESIDVHVVLVSLKKNTVQPYDSILACVDIFCSITRFNHC